MRALTLGMAIAAASVAGAQQKPLPTAEQQIATAVMAMPETFRADATVMGWKTPGGNSRCCERERTG